MVWHLGCRVECLGFTTPDSPYSVRFRAFRVSTVKPRTTELNPETWPHNLTAGSDLDGKRLESMRG